MIRDIIKYYNFSEIFGYTYSKSIKSKYNACIDFEQLSFIDSKTNISEKFLQLLIEYFNTLDKPLFVFYMYDLESNKELSNEKKEIILKIIDLLIKHDFMVIVFMENKIRSYNLGENFDSEAIRKEN